ncbi:hypothetical protein SGLAD_v1c08400 [Spiroplasma gladiatoris]|uniref:Antitoxin SocA-like Panacea domain-containing protein n=1 Tax=Spiroplasma gladiatoris TaxID=2143 RepID=A0A4V1AQC7_9MOLU|nr:type II toxin-antitoxin system antitoxin SocA domain-containing protein [Spiroplasma gladiatoris]QBQ08039.1 hypothetical protein SGLAD_v1c08400 [Spiroplasma gladiatoris]
MFFYSKKDYINFVINLLAKQNINQKFKITQIQIQKIIYIVYAYFLIFKKPIANIDFETWRWGPVIYELWKEQTKYKDQNIPLLFDVNLDKINYDYSEYNVASLIVSFMLNLNSWDIVQICHEQTPWKKLYRPNKNIKIKDNDIFKFHNENPNNFFCYIDFIVNNQK